MACSGDVVKDVQADEGSLGPVNNEDIADANCNITVSPMEGINVDYVPEQAWDHFEAW